MLIDTSCGSAAAPAAFPAARSARAGLSEEISRLERALADVQVWSFPHAGLSFARPDAASSRGPRLLALSELEALRDELAHRLADGRHHLEQTGREQERHRVRLERMLLAPGRHRFETVSRQQVGEDGCGVWQVRPRLGLIGMLAGWWHVKISSGCPLATARRVAPG